MATDECKTVNVLLQENGIIRDLKGVIIGRMRPIRPGENLDITIEGKDGANPT